MKKRQEKLHTRPIALDAAPAVTPQKKGMQLILPKDMILSVEQAVAFHHIHLHTPKGGEYVRINSQEFWRPILGKGYRKVLESIPILIDESYQAEGDFVDGYAKGYRTKNVETRTQWLEGPAIERYRRYKERLEYKSRKEEKLTPTESVYRQSVWDDLHAHTIDEEDAEADVEKEFQRLLSEATTPEEAQHAHEFRRTQKVAIFKIKHRHHWMTFCGSGRTHTIFTNTSKVVMKHVKIHGQELQEVDVANCQPLILLHYFLTLHERDLMEEAEELVDCATTGKHHIDLMPDRDWYYTDTDIMSQPTKMGHTEALFKIHEDLENTVAMVKKHRPALERLLKAASEGKYYEALMSDEMTRGEAKLLHMRLAYGRKKEELKNEDAAAYQAVCRSLKQTAYHVLPKRITRIEAGIFTKAGIELWKQGIHKNCRHDSISAFKHHEESVKQAITKAFETETGITPIVKGSEQTRRELKQHSTLETGTTQTKARAHTNKKAQPTNHRHPSGIYVGYETILDSAVRNDPHATCIEKVCRGPPRLILRTITSIF